MSASFAKTFSAQSELLTADIVTVEADISRGLHSFTIVGLPDKAVEEARDRVAAAIKNSGFASPKSRNHKITISLAPADLRKEGPAFDLPIALAYLLAARDIAGEMSGKLFLGELSLDGVLRPVRGVLASVRAARDAGFSEAYVPPHNAREAALIDGITIYAPGSLSALLQHIGGKNLLAAIPPTDPSVFSEKDEEELSFDDIRGQEHAKRALLIAAAGGHNVLLSGPPGTGKTMLARSLASILPGLVGESMLEATAIHSSAGLLRSGIIARAPFRSPHHTSSYVSLVGGGAVPRPGEVTLAHHGVLFLDEFPEFDRRVIDALREPLEERVVTISRARGSAQFPANFILVAAMNPCPCGNLGSTKQCVCMPLALERYRRKISGPILDRIDIAVEVPNIPHDKLSGKNAGGTSARMQRVVRDARAKQRARGRAGLNASLSVRELDAAVSPTPEALAALKEAAAKLALSPRAYHRTLKVARTIADMEDAPHVETPHVLEALQYRPRMKL